MWPHLTIFYNEDGKKLKERNKPDERKIYYHPNGNKKFEKSKKSDV